MECLAQSEKALTMSIIKESTKLPSSKAFGSPFHPGFEFGYENFFKDKRKHLFSFSIKLGYYFHKEFYHGLTIKPAINYYYVTDRKLYFGAEINSGYLHIFHDKKLFEQNNNGEYQKINNYGKPKFMPSLALSSGYQFHKNDQNHIDLFVKYEFGLEMPFSKGIGIPVFPHSFIHLGTKWYAFN